MPLAKAAIKHGYSVTLATNVAEHRNVIEEGGVNIVDVNFRRSSLNPIKDVLLINKLLSLYKHFKPDLAHHIGMKPVLYGSLVSLISRGHSVINTFPGLGYLYASNSWGRKIIRTILELAFRVLFLKSTTKVTFQNHDDQAYFVLKRISHKKRSYVMGGVGVDLEKYVYVPEEDGIVTVALVSRLIKDKGILDFAEAAKICLEQGHQAKFVLVGDIDQHNPMSITESEIKLLQDSGFIEWWGFYSDMTKIYSKVHIICLPTYYREGLPTVLVEAAASGRPVVATDVPGCIEIAIDGWNGFTVPVKTPSLLAEAIIKLIRNKKLRIEMGLHGRKLVEEKFSVDVINAKTLELYDSCF